MGKRMWAVLLAVCLTIGLLPTIALAGGGDSDLYREGYLRIMYHDEQVSNNTVEKQIVDVLLNEEETGLDWSYDGKLNLTLSGCDLESIYFYPYKQETSTLTITLVGTNNVSAGNNEVTVLTINSDTCIDTSRKGGSFVFSGDGSLTTDCIHPGNGGKATFESGTVTMKSSGQYESTMEIKEGAELKILAGGSAFRQISFTVAGTLDITEPNSSNRTYWQDTCVITGDGEVIVRGGLNAPKDSILWSHYDVTNDAGQKGVMCTAQNTPSPLVVLAAENEDTTVDPAHIKIGNGHDMTATVKEVTCEEDGKAAYHCTACGDIKEIITPKLGHNFNKWTVAKEPTETTEGISESICSNGCGSKQTQIIPVLTPLPKFAITVESAEHGTVTCEQAEAEVNEYVTITVIPEAGYQGSAPSVKDADSNIISVHPAGENTYGFVMPASAVIITPAAFTSTQQPPVSTTYAVTVPQAANGNVSVTPATARAGETVTIITTPNQDYRNGTPTVTGASGSVNVTKVNDTTYTFTMPSEAVTVSVSFEPSLSLVYTPYSRMSATDKQQYYGGKLEITGLTAGTKYVVTFDNGLVTNGVIPRLVHVVTADGSGNAALSCQDGVNVMVFRVTGDDVSQNLVPLYNKNNAGVPVNSLTSGS